MPTLQYELLNQERKMQETKKRVAAYCRVSTDNERNGYSDWRRTLKDYLRDMFLQI